MKLDATNVGCRAVAGTATARRIDAAAAAAGAPFQRAARLKKIGGLPAGFADRPADWSERRRERAGIKPARGTRGRPLTAAFEEALLFIPPFLARRLLYQQPAKMSSDEEHEVPQFQSADAGSSTTYPMQAGSIRKNMYIVIKGRPCKVRARATAGHTAALAAAPAPLP